MKKKIILITGAAGFIGANLIRQLINQDVQIHLLLKTSTDLWRINSYVKQKRVVIHFSDFGDIQALTKTVQKIQPSVIYHLAAYGASHWQNEPQHIFETNIFGTLNLLTACQTINYQLFINSGSSSEYGYSNQPMTEELTLHPNSYYGIAKATQTLLASYLAQAENKPIVTIRLFSVYGPYETAGKLFPTLFRAISSQTPITLTNKKAAHDFIFVGDVVSGLLQTDVLAQYPGQIINFGTGIQTSLVEVVKVAEKVTGQKVRATWDKTKAHRWDNSNWVADTTKVKTILPWHPRSFADGLSNYWQWYQQHQSIY
ncbi:MAG: hypothetical protein COY81_03045 [Candidatus Pacebacteria bacterium CG_4_10_14_0_8_um_filter_43_12]|nr:MAG: hypothetical protein COY81_03045 [Candidatus Pacebacteria bacterium CG_4_10_14_0_8_um_filter_43_12]